MKVLDEVRNQGIIGIMQGADKFVTSLIETRARDPDNNEESEHMLILTYLKKQINAIERNKSYKPDRPKVNADQPSTISLAFHSEASNPGKANIPKEALASMLEKTEQTILEMFARTHTYYKLIGQASVALNTFQYLDDIEQMLEKYRIDLSRRKCILSYLERAKCLTPPKEEFLTTHVKELGARIAQDLLACLNIQPCYAYTPFEEAELPPEELPVQKALDRKKTLKGGNRT